MNSERRKTKPKQYLPDESGVGERWWWGVLWGDSPGGKKPIETKGRRVKEFSGGGFSRPLQKARTMVRPKKTLRSRREEK